MSPDDPRLIRLARQILDGSPIDWDGLESDFSEPDEALVLASMRRIAGVVALHGRAAALATAETASTAGDSRDPRTSLDSEAPASRSAPIAPRPANPMPASPEVSLDPHATFDHAQSRASGEGPIAANAQSPSDPHRSGQSTADSPREGRRVHSRRDRARASRSGRSDSSGSGGEAGEPQPSMAIGARWGHLEIRELLGMGAFGEVYLGWDSTLHREVALKLLRTGVRHTSNDAIESALREARNLARIRHPNVVTVFGAEKHDERVGVWMEFVDGQTLEEFVAEHGSMSAREAALIGIELCRALTAVHQTNLVHQDLKCRNVMREEGGRIILMDFGTGTDMRDAERRARMSGTPTYMAPELFLNLPATPQSDVYSLGVLLYYLVTCEYPVEGDSLAAFRQAHTSGKRRLLREARADLPHEFVRVVERALQRDPRERFGSAGEMEEALASAFETRTSHALPLAPAARHRPRRWAWAVAALLLVGTLAALGTTQPWKRWLAPSAADKALHPNWILVAEFEGPPGSGELARAVRELVIGQLDQSSIVTPIRSSDLRLGLSLAMLPDTTHVVGNVARQLAYRASARTYVEGRIDKILTGYSIVLRVLSSEEDRVVASATAIASDDDAVISTVSRLASEIREKLGEAADAVRGTRTFSPVITPSFDAYMRFIQAKAAEAKGQREAGKRLHWQAVRTDPDFALAWGHLFISYWNGGQPDSARFAYDEMMKRPTRLTEAQRLGYQATAEALLSCDYDAALRTFETLATVEPTNSAFTNRGAILQEQGRVEEAIELYARFAEFSPWGLNSVALENWYRGLLTLERVDAAAEVVAKLPPALRPLADLEVACAAERWAAADSMVKAALLDPDCPSNLRSTATLVRASLAAQRGQVGSALAEWDRLGAIPGAAGARFAQLSACMLRNPPGRTSMGRTPASAGAAETDVFDAAYQAAVCEDTASVATHLARIRALPDCQRKRHERDIAFLEGSIAATRGDARALVPLAEPGQGIAFAVGTLPVRWLLARAQENSGDAAAAAHTWEAILRLDHTDEGDRFYVRPFLLPFAHRALALSYARLGRTEQARQHAFACEKLWSDPDPHIAPLLEELRTAVASTAPAR